MYTLCVALYIEKAGFEISPLGGVSKFEVCLRCVRDFC